MIPVLLEIPIPFLGITVPIYSFGVMVALAYLSANYFLSYGLRLRMIPQAEIHASNITLLALLGGIGGAKLFHILENFNEFLSDPKGTLMSGAGLTFLGGFILATSIIYIYIRIKKLDFFTIADASSLSLTAGYGIGRIGCQLSGDGDYGIPTDVPWAMSYSKGIVSTLSSRNADLVEQFKSIFPEKPIPEDILVHPAPIYETLSMLIVFIILWQLQKRFPQSGFVFGAYLIFAGIERLCVEFIRLNPLYFGLSQAQWISILLIIAGIFLAKSRYQKLMMVTGKS